MATRNWKRARAAAAWCQGKAGSKQKENRTGTEKHTTYPKSEQGSRGKIGGQNHGETHYGRKWHQLYFGRGWSVLEALFTEWIVKSIKKGGIANIILPDGIFTNIGNNKLKQLIIENCYIDSIISLPVGTFFNTPKKTFILTIHKRTEEEMNKIQSYPVYTYLCSTIGETMDTYRFDIDENDLHDAVDLYNLYRGNKENKIAISAVNDNPRAKLIPVDKFGIEENWNIELFWSDEEKIELGIKKKDTIMSLEEFHGYISELIDDIKNYQEAIECLK